jgi:hypothetical protein
VPGIAGTELAGRLTQVFHAPTGEVAGPAVAPPGSHLSLTGRGVEACGHLTGSPSNLSRSEYDDWHGSDRSMFGGVGSVPSTGFGSPSTTR